MYRNCTSLAIDMLYRLIDNNPNLEVIKTEAFAGLTKNANKLYIRNNHKLRVIEPTAMSLTVGEFYLVNQNALNNISLANMTITSHVYATERAFTMSLTVHALVRSTISM